MTIQLRRGTAAEWTAANPILAAGEPGVELDTGKQKVGNGTSAWSALAYSVGASAYEVAVAEGFVGDVTAWLASLEGAAGATGAQGPQGIPGTAFTDWMQVPTGAMDGVNMDYTFTPTGGGTIAPGAILLFAAGVPRTVCQTPLTNADFTQNGNVFTNNGRPLVSAAPDNDTIYACF